MFEGNTLVKNLIIAKREARAYKKRIYYEEKSKIRQPDMKRYRNARQRLIEARARKLYIILLKTTVLRYLKWNYY